MSHASVFVMMLDITERLRKQYVTDRIDRYVAPDGSLHSPHDAAFYRDPLPREVRYVGLGTGWSHGIAWTSKDWGDGRGYRARVQFLPEGWQEQEVPIRVVMSFRDFCEEWHGIPFLPQGHTPDLVGDHHAGYGIHDTVGEVVAVYQRIKAKEG